MKKIKKTNPYYEPKFHECPYYSSNTKTCSNRYTKANRKSKRICIFKDKPKKCEMYIDWLKTKKAASEVA